MSRAFKKYCEEKGRQVAVARHCKVTPQAVTKWLNSRVPAERVLDVVEATGGKITCHQLRPDIYKAETGAAA